MSLAAESPVHSSSSSSSGDFAAFIDAELDLDSSGTHPEEEEEEEDFQVQRSTKRKLEDSTSDDETANSRDDDICPPHPGFIRRMCMRCGQVEEDESGVALSYIHKDLRLGNKEIDRLRRADLKNLLHAKKLILILDLDHTLLNSTRVAEMTSEEEYLKHQPESSEGVFKLPGMHLLTKLRPFLRTFLEEASKMFEMYLYTMGERAYALEIAKILDPNKIYFDSRVISRSDSTKQHQKGLDVVLAAECAVVILDDTEVVWQAHEENLILMERYRFFQSSCRQFGLDARSLKDECELDDALLVILDVLKRAHRMFFAPPLETDVSSRDVRHVLRDIRQEILQGCKIVFSRVFPSKVIAEDQPIWKLARQMGAICSTEVGPSVTHVVSMDKSTEKASWALKNDKFLVNPRWIEAANYLWRRQREEDFKIVSKNKICRTAMLVEMEKDSVPFTSTINRYTKAGDVGSVEHMSLVLDEAEEANVKKNTRKELGASENPHCCKLSWKLLCMLEDVNFYVNNNQSRSPVSPKAIRFNSSCKRCH